MESLGTAVDTEIAFRASIPSYQILSSQHSSSVQALEERFRRHICDWVPAFGRFARFSLGFPFSFRHIRLWAFSSQRQFRTVSGFIFRWPTLACQITVLRVASGLCVISTWNKILVAAPWPIKPSSAGVLSRLLRMHFSFGYLVCPFLSFGVSCEKGFRGCCARRRLLTWSDVSLGAGRRFGEWDLVDRPRPRGWHGGFRAGGFCRARVSACSHLAV